MKSLTFAILCAALALSSTPALAQMGMGSPSDQLLKAVRDRDGDTTTQLLNDNRTIVNTKGVDGDTPLLIAIRRGDTEWTGFLLNRGADPDLAGNGGDTPLIAAARVGMEQAAEWLIGFGAKVNATNKMGETPLIVAVQRRNRDLVKLLLADGADPDIADSAAGYSARDYAQRDPRARDILQLIDDKKPKGGSGSAK